MAIHSEAVLMKPDNRPLHSNQNVDRTTIARSPKHALTNDAKTHVLNAIHARRTLNAECRNTVHCASALTAGAAIHSGNVSDVSVFF